MHEIRVFIAPPATAAGILEQVPLMAGVAAPNGWQVLPLTSRVLEELVGREVPVPDLDDPGAGGLFAELSGVVLAALSSRVEGLTGAIAATQYWGGAGAQAAVAVASGRSVFPASVGAGAINRALASLRCPLLPGLDAFDSVGIGRWRNMSSFGG